MLKMRRQHGKRSRECRAARNMHSKICKRKKRLFERRLTVKLLSLKHADPRKYWKLLKAGYGKNPLGEICMEEWFDHFSNLSGHTRSEEEESILDDTEEEEGEKVYVWCLDKPISKQEVRDAVLYSIKYHKANGIE